MKSIVLLTTLFLHFSLSIYAQVHSFDPANAREGENVEYCFQHILHKKMLENASYVQSLQQDAVTRQHEQQHINTPKGTIYKIPIVFHVLHVNGVENTSDAQILDGLAILNRDFRKLNADANTVQPEFTGKPADIEVEFVLATKAPDGTCFNGITRTVSPLSYDGSDGFSQVAAIIAGNTIYQGEWPSDQYLNVFVCGDIGGAAGYTWLPSSWGGTSTQNGIWMLHNYLGSIGTSSVNTSRTLTHEVGHWLNLNHTWGGTNNPNIPDNCSTDDDVLDTPDCIGVTGCSINANTCNNDDAYWGFPIHDNVENYMDYSYCSKMFTQGQATRMRAALNSFIGGRNNLWTPSNLQLVGADGTSYLCKADFYTSKKTVCTGVPIQFTDASYNKTTGWTWSFPGGTPATSTAKNPLVTYSAPGVYSITLVATDGTTTDDEVKTGYIHVIDSGVALPFFDGFENYSSLTNNPNWSVYSSINNAAFKLETSTGHTGTKCVMLNNVTQTGSNIDELISGKPVDLSTVTSVATLSFRFAYRKISASTYEGLRVFVSNNCGATWVQRKTLIGSNLSSLVEATPWKPSTMNDWTTVHVVNLTSEYWVNNLLYKFKFEGNGGNNFYLDDINIYQGTPSDAIVLGENELHTEFNDFSLSPNPAEKELNLHFSVDNAQAVNLQIVDVFGKTRQSNVINAASGSNLVVLSTEDLAKGTYFVSIQHQGSSHVLKFVKQ